MKFKTGDKLIVLNNYRYNSFNIGDKLDINIDDLCASIGPDKHDSFQIYDFGLLTRAIRDKWFKYIPCES